MTPACPYPPLGYICTRVGGHEGSCALVLVEDPTKCTLPPAGWICSRASGHDGPCAALPEGVTALSTPGEHILQFFSYRHLPIHLAMVSEPFFHLANEIVRTLPRNPERTVALRKLLEAKDAAVRAKLAK